MKCIFENPDVDNIRKLKILLRQFRSLLTEVHDFFENPTHQKYARNQTGMEEARCEIAKLRNAIRVLSLFVENEWMSDTNFNNNDFEFVGVVEDIFNSRCLNILNGENGEEQWKHIKSVLKNVYLGSNNLPGGNFSEKLIGVYKLRKSNVVEDECCVEDEYDECCDEDDVEPVKGC
jgi:hypothetical protein